jgi:hypothetical protein|tara:strand:+ start:49 stop:192 length:144 start_codon:yes stop_codon:yes gene_type:complete
MVRILAAKILFYLARVLQSRGMLLGQWFQNKGILMLAKAGEIDNEKR